MIYKMQIKGDLSIEAKQWIKVAPWLIYFDNLLIISFNSSKVGNVFKFESGIKNRSHIKFCSVFFAHLISDSEHKPKIFLIPFC